MGIVVDFCSFGLRSKLNKTPTISADSPSAGHSDTSRFSDLRAQPLGHQPVGAAEKGELCESVELLRIAPDFCGCSSNNDVTQMIQDS